MMLRSYAYCRSVATIIAYNRKDIIAKWRRKTKHPSSPKSKSRCSSSCDRSHSNSFRTLRHREAPCFLGNPMLLKRQSVNQPAYTVIYMRTREKVSTVYMTYRFLIDGDIVHRRRWWTDWLHIHCRRGSIPGWFLLVFGGFLFCAVEPAGCRHGVCLA